MKPTGSLQCFLSAAQRHYCATPRRSDLIGSVLARDQMLHLLTGNGNEGIGYHFGQATSTTLTKQEVTT